MADTAAFLVDRVLPKVPVRQWVLSLPIALRYKIAYDSQLAAEVLQLFVRSVFASLRRRARLRYGRAAYECGSATFIQRFGDALNLNLHFHAIVLDFAYAAEPDDTVRFHRLQPPTNAEVEQTTRRIVRQLRRQLIQRGLTPDADAAAAAADSLPDKQSFLAEIYAASVRSRFAMGERAGPGVLRIGDLVDPEEAAFVTSPRCAMIDGVSLHANVSVPSRDRRRLEKLCRYIARPPVSTERLSKLSDGRLLCRLKRKWRDGTTHVVFQPLELLEKLAAIVPPPRIHVVRYHGVLAPRAACRRNVVPAAAARGHDANRPGADASDCSDISRSWTFAARCSLARSSTGRSHAPSLRRRRAQVPKMRRQDEDPRDDSPARSDDRNPRIAGTLSPRTAHGALTAAVHRRRGALLTRPAPWRQAPRDACPPPRSCVPRCLAPGTSVSDTES